MGCDIHIRTEYFKNGRWHNCDHFYCDDESLKIEPAFNLCSIYDGRDYEMFGYLAGVRSDPLINFNFDRGLPDDVTFVTKKSCLDWCQAVSVHHTGYCTLKELKESIAFAMKRYNASIKLDFSCFDYLISVMEARKKEVFDIFYGDGFEKDDQFRIVFWFDN